MSKIEVNEVKKLFNDEFIVNSITDIYKEIHLTFEKVYKDYDKIQLEMHNSDLNGILLEAFENAYSNGDAKLAEEYILLADWIESFARNAKHAKISKQDFLFLSAGIVFGITNMIREFREIRLHPF